MRPLFYEFPTEPAAAAVQHSFMLGERGAGRGRLNGGTRSGRQELMHQGPRGVQVQHASW